MGRASSRSIPQPSRWPAVLRSTERRTTGSVTEERQPALAGSPDSMPKRRAPFDTDRVKRGAVLVCLPSDA